MGSRKGALSITFTVLPFTKPISTMRLRKPPWPATFTMTPHWPVDKSDNCMSLFSWFANAKLRVLPMWAITRCEYFFTPSRAGTAPWCTSALPYVRFSSRISYCYAGSRRFCTPTCQCFPARVQLFPCKGTLTNRRAETRNPCAAPPPRSAVTEKVGRGAPDAVLKNQNARCRKEK